VTVQLLQHAANGSAMHVGVASRRYTDRHVMLIDGVRLKRMALRQ
jgi:hypothetical protein